MRFDIRTGALLAAMAPGVACAAASETVLYKFQGGTDGASPHGELIADSAGNLYGTTNLGGITTGACVPSGCGTVFRLAPPASGQTAWTRTILYSFKAGTDGGFPYDGVIADGQGNLFGTTARGGNVNCNGTQGCGTVYRLAPPAAGHTAWTETVLHSFAGGTDGGYPTERLTLDSSGTLYGTAPQGGSADCQTFPGCGVVFSLTPPSVGKKAWTEAILYRFKGGTDGFHPASILIPDSAGNLYGATLVGGIHCGADVRGCGTIFKLKHPAAGKTVWLESVIHRFKGGRDGIYPTSLLLSGNGTFYGATEWGGGSCAANTQGAVYGCGTVFQLNPPNLTVKVWTETVLERLENTQAGNLGLYQAGQLATDSAGNLFGVTTSGGASNNGLVFKLAPPASGKTAWHPSALHSFAGGTGDGAILVKGLLTGADGALYGTTLVGGGACPSSTNGCGVVFKVTP